MAEFNYFGPQEGSLDPDFPMAPPRKRRPLTMQEMTSMVPFSPMPKRRDESEPPRFAPPQEVQAQAYSDELRGGDKDESGRLISYPNRRDLTSIPTQGPGIVRRTAAPPAPTSAAAGPGAPAPSPQAGAAPPGGAVTPAMLRQQAYDAAQRSIEESGKLPDMTEQANRYRERYEEAGPDMGLAMFLGGVGGKMGQEMGGQIFKQALSRRQPETTAYGTLDAGGFTADPMKQRDFQIAKLEKQAQLLETMASHAATEEERVRAHQAAEQLRRDALQMHREKLASEAATRNATLAQGRFTHFTDQATGENRVLNTRTGEILGGGGGGPGGFRIDALPKQATAEEKNKYATSSEMIVRGTRLAQEVAADPEAFGLAAGFTSSAAKRTGIPFHKLNLTPEQQQLRSGVFQQAYETINKLAGAALSAHEAGRIMQFTPGPNDDAETIVANLNSAVREAQTQRGVLRQRYGMDRGGQEAPPGGGAPPAPAPGPKPVLRNAIVNTGNAKKDADGYLRNAS